MLTKLEEDVGPIPNTFIKLRFSDTYVIIGPNPYTYNSNNKPIRSYTAIRKIHERILIFCEKVFRLKPDSVRIFDVQYNGTYICNILTGNCLSSKIKTKVIGLSQARYYYNSTNVRVYLYVSDTNFQKLIQMTNVYFGKTVGK